MNVTDPPSEGAPRPRLLDLFCGAGGASVGYHRAGFDIVGWDNKPHPDYPFEIHLGDAMEVVKDRAYLDTFDVVAGSPPCPRYSVDNPRAHPRPAPRLPAAVPGCAQGVGWCLCDRERHRRPDGSSCDAVRVRVRASRRAAPPVRVQRAFLMSPGCMHAVHVGGAVGVYGDHWDREGGWLRPDGTSRGRKATSVEDAQHALGIDWMTTWDDLTDAIPPAYTHYLGDQLMDRLAAERAA